MKHTLLILSALFAMTSTPALAYINSQEEAALITAMNQANPQARVEGIRCSLLHRMCLVKMEIGPRALKQGCMIERIADASDLYTDATTVDGKLTVALAPYTQSALSQCIRQAL